MRPEKVRFPQTFQERAKSADNPEKRRLTLRELAKRVGVSTEHVRKIINDGQPVLSEEVSKKLCEILGIDAVKEMWREIERAKIKRSYPAAAADVIEPSNPEGKRRRVRETAKTYVVTYCRRALVKAVGVVEAAIQLKKSCAEPVHVSSVRRVWLDEEQRPLIGDPTTFDESIGNMGVRTVYLPMTRQAGRLLRAMMGSAEHEFGADKLVAGWEITADEWRALRDRLDHIVRRPLD